MKIYTVFWSYSGTNGSFEMHSVNAKVACGLAVEELVDDLVDSDEPDDFDEMEVDYVRDHIELVAYEGRHTERPDYEPDGKFT